MCKKEKTEEGKKGITGLEIAIIVVGFVVIATIFTYTVLKAGTSPAQGLLILEEVVESPDGWTLRLENGQVYQVDKDVYCDVARSIGRISLRCNFLIE